MLCMIKFLLNYSDMSASTETSGIVEFFKKKSVFITGATGFIGKQLVEKLVRSCPDIENIYLLVRPKRGHNVNDRIKELFSSPVRFLKPKKGQNLFLSFSYLMLLEQLIQISNKKLSLYKVIYLILILV